MTDSPSSPDTAQTPAAKTSKHARKRLRFLLLFLLPLAAVLVGGYFYISSQRYVSTDNAYVKADMVAISARVSAPILAVAVAENQPVEKGDVLFRLSPENFKVALDSADAELGRVRDEIAALKATYKQKEQELNLAQVNVEYAALVFERQSKLRKQGIASQAVFDAAAHDLATARRQVAALRFDLDRTLASLGGDPQAPVENHPLYRQAKAGRDQALLDQEHTVVTAPFAGIASKTPKIGQYVEAGASVMSIVANHGAWVEANFKETDLAYIRKGQAVSVKFDAYPDYVWEGRLESFSQATGSEFSVLPAQNASGNWVKVVQRIPLRIALKPLSGTPVLRAGMSAAIEIDTGHQPALPGFLLTAVGWLDGLFNVSTAFAEDRP